MTISSAYRVGFKQPISQATSAQQWTKPWLRQAVARLQRQVVGQPQNDHDRCVIEEIVNLGMQPDLLAALRQRHDPQEAVRDLATRYAFAALMVEGRPVYELDTLSSTLIQHTLNDVRQRAARLVRRLKVNPLQADDGLLLSICRTISHYTLHKPMGAHISTKLKLYESDVRRAMRQIRHLVTRPDITASFLTYVSEVDTPEGLKDQLRQIAEEGKLEGVDYEAVIRFFARPETVAFVKRFAGTVQTARTLYTEEEYAEIAWRGKRRLPDKRRQGYLEIALAYYKRYQDVSLDAPRKTQHGDDDADWYEVLPQMAADDDLAWTRVNALHKESFEVWVTRHALDTRPHDPLWQAGELLFVQGLSPDEIEAQGLADHETLAAVRERVEALQANTDVWHAWMATTMG